MNNKYRVEPYCASFRVTDGQWRSPLCRICADAKELCRRLNEAKPQQWVPVTEELPDENGNYIVTLRNGTVSESYYSLLRSFALDAVAWLRNIEPYVPPEPELPTCICGGQTELTATTFLHACRCKYGCQLTGPLCKDRDSAIKNFRRLVKGYRKE